MDKINLLILLTLAAVFLGALILTNYSPAKNEKSLTLIQVSKIPQQEWKSAIISIPSQMENGTFTPSDPAPALPLSKQMLTIYTYDGITSEWGLGPKIFPMFEKTCDCTVRVVAKGDVGVFISQLIFEKQKPEADIALGFDNSFLGKVFSEDLLEEYAPENLADIDPQLVNANKRVTPFDFGYLAFVYDSEKVKNPPKSLEDLAQPEFSRKIILEDPKTSSPGKIFLYWVGSEYGEKTKDYLDRLKPNLLTITPGWSEAYNLFLAGEAPIVLSYSTSPAYHIINENTTKYKAAIFPKMYRQIEYVGLVKGSKNKQLAEKFITFLIGKKAQEQIPLGNYMYPIRSDVALPDAFTLVQKPNYSYPENSDGEKLIELWEKTFQN